MSVAATLHIGLGILSTPLIGDDAFLHLSWLEDFVSLRSQGIDYPRWLPDTFGGIGSPTFYFYPPLCYFLASLLEVSGIASTGTTLFHAISVVFLVVSFATMYWLLRYHAINSYTSVVCALLYSVSAYRYVDVFTRAALAEHAALAWLPLVILSIDHCLRQVDRIGKLKALVFSALVWSALILTHIPTTVIAALIAVTYSLVLARTQLLRLLPSMLGAVLGALMCSLYLLPLFHFQPFIQTGRLWGFDVVGSEWHHFLYELFAPGARKSAIQGAAAFTFLHAILCIGALVLANRAGNGSKIYTAILWLLAIFLVLQLPLIADPIWEVLKPLQLLQFSWRLAGGLVLATAFALAFLIDRGSRSAQVLLLVGALFGLALYLRYIFILTTYPAPPYMVEPVRKGAPEYTNQYVKLERDSLRPWAMSIMDDPVLSSDVRFRSEIAIDKADTLAGYFDADQPFSLHIKRLWWPQWRIEILYETSDGEERSTGRKQSVEADSNGLIVVRGLDDGPARFLLTMEKSHAEQTGEMLSLIGVGIFSVICLIGLTHTRRKTY